MAEISINPLNPSPLAALAGNSVGNLGLKEYGLDVGAPAQGYADGFWKAQQLKLAQSQQQNMYNIAKMQETGALTRTEYSALMAQSMEQYKQSQETLRAKATNQIAQQNANANQSNAQSNMLNTQGLNAFRGGQLQNQQQANQNTASFNKGTLDIGQQNADSNRMNAQSTIMQNQFNNALTMDNRKLNQSTQLGTAITTGFQLYKDPKQQLDYVNRVLDQANQMGIDTSFYKGKGLDDISKTAMGSMFLGHNALQAKGMASMSGVQFGMDTQGNLITLPSENKTSESFNKNRAEDLKSNSDQLLNYNNLQSSIGGAETALNNTPGAQLGPMPYGAWLSQTAKIPQAMALNGALNNVVINLKQTTGTALGKRFTPQVQEFLGSITGGLHDYKGSIQDLLTGTKQATYEAQKNTWTDADKNASYDTIGYKQWQSQNPAPVQPEVTIGNGQQKMSISTSDWMKNQSEFVKNGWGQTQ